MEDKVEIMQVVFTSKFVKYLVYLLNTNANIGTYLLEYESRLVSQVGGTTLIHIQRMLNKQTSLLFQYINDFFRS